MKNFFLLIIFQLHFACGMNNDFWKILDPKLPKNYSIEVVKVFSDSIFFIAGKISNENIINEVRPFIRYTFNGGKNWDEKQDFLFDFISDLYSNQNQIIVKGYLKSHINGIMHQELYKFDINYKEWSNIDLGEIQDPLRFISIFSKNQYLIDISRDQSIKKYLVSNDAGKSWQQKAISMNSVHDFFYPNANGKNKIWGTRTINQKLNESKTKEIQYISYIDIGTEKIIDHIKFGNIFRNSTGHNISNKLVSSIVETDSFLYILGQNELTDSSYIWKYGLDGQFIFLYELIDSKKNQPNTLFINGNEFIVVSTDITSYFSSKVVSIRDYKGDWTNKAFPSLSFGYYDFSNGILAGIVKGRLICYHSFLE